MPTLNLSNREINHNGKTVGRFAVEEETGRIVPVRWVTRLRMKDSYTITCDLFEELRDYPVHYVVDRETGELFKFLNETYSEAEIIELNNQLQFAPPKTEAVDDWENAENHFVD